MKKLLALALAVCVLMSMLAVPALAKELGMPFTDVKEGDWFYTPVLWAVQTGYTAGTTATTFSPRESVTTAEILTFLWAFAGRLDFGVSDNPFTDVSPDKYYYRAVLWAYYGGILVGNEGSGSTLNPKGVCTRAHVVTYLYHYFMNEFHCSIS